MESIGRKLRKARKDQALSLRDLAAQAEVSASLLSQIENNRSNPSVRTLYSLATVLSLSVDYFNDLQESAKKHLGERFGGDTNFYEIGMEVLIGNFATIEF